MDCFQHENQGTFPSLSDMGDLRHGTKSDLMGCLESLIKVPQKDMPGVETKIVDGSVVLNRKPLQLLVTTLNLHSYNIWSIYCRHRKYALVLFGTVRFREALEIPQGKSAVQVVESL